MLSYVALAGLLLLPAALLWAAITSITWLVRSLRDRTIRDPDLPNPDLPNPDLLGRAAETMRQRAEHRRNVSALRHQHGIPIERLAADLRRLRRIVASDASSSAAHQLGNRMAYDRVLIESCEMLGIEHELDRNTAGHHRDIERLRVEAELEGAGLVLSTRYGRAA